jgi:hypothetical protein
MSIIIKKCPIGGPTTSTTVIIIDRPKINVPILDISKRAFLTTKNGEGGGGRDKQACNPFI